jgi:glycosyltransferase involved in cell wall biosynthesis
MTQQARLGQPNLSSAGTDASIRASIDRTVWKPEIAIITITKDDPTGIKKTVASVEQQDFSPYEHVVVDGGSSADVAGWLKSWHDGDPQTHVLVQNPPPGIYPAMNAGIQSTSAPMILVLNGGDQLLPGALRSVSDDYKLHGWRWAYGDTEVRDPSGRLMGHETFTPFSRSTFRAGLNYIPHQSAYVTRNLYEEVGLYREDLGIGADQEFFLRASLVAEPAQLPRILAIFETGGVSSQEGLISREISWHRMRLASNTAFGSHPATELAATAMLIARQFLIRAVRKIRKIAGWKR